MTENILLKWAQFYYEKMNFSIIPIKKDKTPYIKWESYQKEKPTIEEINEWWGSKWPDANIGIVTGKLSGITVIDIDSEKGNQAIEQYLPDNLVTPITKSPKGKHLYFEYKEGISNATRFLDDCDIRSEGGYIIAPPSSNGKGKMYQWLLQPFKNDISALPEELSNIIINSLYIGGHKNIKLQEATKATTGYKILEGQRDDELFHIGYALAKGFMQEEEVQYYLELMGLYCCDPPFEKDEVKAKIKSITKRLDKMDRNISFLVREWVLATGGYFSATSGHNELHLATRNEKRAANAEFQRMCKEGLIERYGEKKGMYRVVSQVVKFEDFKSADDTPLDIRLPFGFEKYVDLFPGDLITFQGVRNVGKTAIGLELTRLNMKRWPVYYFSREIKKHGLKKRLKKHESISLEDWNFKFASEFNSFIDILQPDAVNIIDYLEVKEGEYFKFPSILADIHQHLKGNAIAIVMLQKRTGKDTGAGGEALEEKPVLVFNIDPNYPDGAILTAKKVKNRKDDDFNVEGYQIKFKLRAGINFFPNGIWQPEMED